MTTKITKSKLVLAHWENYNYFPYGHRDGESDSVTFSFRHSDERSPDITKYEERSINLGLYVWLSEDGKRASVVFRGRGIHSLTGDKLVALGRYVNSLNKKGGTSEGNFLNIESAAELHHAVLTVLQEAGVTRSALNNNITQYVDSDLKFLREAIFTLYERCTGA